jgi:hypothetical protein
MSRLSICIGMQEVGKGQVMECCDPVYRLFKGVSV